MINPWMRAGAEKLATTGVALMMVVVGVATMTAAPDTATAAMRLQKPAAKALPGSSGAAVKQSVRYQRKTTRVQARGELLRDRVKDAKVEEARRAEQTTPAGPPPLLGQETLEYKVMIEQIGMLKKLLRKTSPTNPEYADLVFRLASLYLDQKMYYEHRAGELYEAVYLAEEAEEAARAPKAAPRGSKGTSKGTSEKAPKGSKGSKGATKPTKRSSTQPRRRGAGHPI